MAVGQRGGGATLVAGVLLAACGGAEPSASTPSAITAEQYDCRAPSPPARRPTARPGCVLDPACDADLVVGHRGTGGNFALWAPENSLSAVRLAILLGVDAIEIDVRHTADEGLVVMHDSSLKRTTGLETDTADLTEAEVTALPLVSEGYHGDFSCARVPSFTEVLALARGRVFLVVDTKTSRGDLVARALRDADMLQGAAISVSNPDTALAARTEVPEVRIQLRPDTVGEYTRMASRFSRAPEILEVPEAELEAFLPVATEAGAKLFTNVFTRDLVAFGAGDLEQYLEPHALGADIVQTEFPMWVLEAQGRRHWSSLDVPRDLGLDVPLLGR